jgi:hypothetical protein
MISKPLQQLVSFYTKKYPPKKDICTIATIWNDYYKQNRDVFELGISYGWLEELMDLKNLKLYDYVPYHFKLGLVVHKNHGGIEEEFLLKDAFDILVKAEYYYEVLIKHASLLKKEVLPLFVWKVVLLRNENRYRTSIGTNTFTIEQSVGNNVSRDR